MYPRSLSTDSDGASADGKSAPEYKFDGYDIVSSEKVALTPPNTPQNKTLVQTRVPGSPGGAR
ncbi:MAG TPA: hypothetical protein VF472_25395 [Burkholderiaceae bacterium]